VAIVAVLGLLIFLFSARLASAAPQDTPATLDISGASIIQDNGWPELQVDGKPFFVHGAAFDYFGVPEDLWAQSLDRYHDLGINTIDLSIPWNWHEPRDGEFDFDGHTNPRRDLRGLLRLIADRGFRLIVHAGPGMPPTWRLAGYPDWLVRAPEFGMTAQQVADGTEPAIAAEFRRDADAAAGDWLAQADFVRASREWFSALGRELSPYDSHKIISIDPPDTWGKAAAHLTSGPLLFVFAGYPWGDTSDEPAFTGAAGAPILSRYVSTICAELAAAGVDAPCLASIGDLPDGWLPAATTNSAAIGPAGISLGADASQTLELLADTLGQRPDMPALITAFHAGGYAAPNEVSPERVASSATIAGTRILLGRGIGGIEYAPLQETLTPAGYETPGTNRYLNRDVALDLEGNRRTPAAAVARNGKLVKAWGQRLASVHLRADLGVIDLRAAELPGDQQSSQREEARRALEQVLRVAELAGRTPEVVDPSIQSVERLLRDPVLLLVAPKTESGGAPDLPARAQQELAEYVRRGGTLIAESPGPTLPGLAPLWSAAGAEMHSAIDPIAIRRTYGDGATILWTRDFYSWLEPSESLGESRAHPEAQRAIRELARLLNDAGAPAVIHRVDSAQSGDALVFSELAGREDIGSPETLGARCTARPLCAAGLLSATNLDSTRAAEADLDVLAPWSASSSGYRGTIHLHVGVPPGDSLLLPLHAPLCDQPKPEERCTDEIISAGAELLGAEREKNALELTFYAPMTAEVQLRLESQPSRAELDENNVNGQWSKPVHMFEVSVLRGAAPDYLRVLKIELRYTPHVSEKPEPPKHPASDFEVSLLNAERLPLGQGPSLGSVPPLILVPHDSDKEEKPQRLVLRTINRGGDEVSFEGRVTGPLKGSDSVRVIAGGTYFDSIKTGTDPVEPPAWPADGRLPGELKLTEGQQELRFPVAFQKMDAGGSFHYAFDFARDGSPDWVLGDEALRLYLSPHDGGRMLALVSASSGENFTTIVGGLRDWFLADGEPEPRDFTFNRAYGAEWIESGRAPAAPTASATEAGGADSEEVVPSFGVRMSYDAPEAGPAGASIQKVIRVIAPATVEARYRVSLKSADGIPVPSPSLEFVSASSLPASSGEDRSTKFCWITAIAPTAAASGSSDACHAFAPFGAPLTPPAGVRHLEVRTPGHATLDFEWSSGALTLVMKSDSVLLEVAVPLADGLPAETTLRYTIGPVE
jgi:glycosyl hydrolase family 35